MDSCEDLLAGPSECEELACSMSWPVPVHPRETASSLPLRRNSATTAFFHLLVLSKKLVWVAWQPSGSLDAILVRPTAGRAILQLMINELSS